MSAQDQIDPAILEEITKARKEAAENFPEPKEILDRWLHPEREDDQIFRSLFGFPAIWKKLKLDRQALIIPGRGDTDFSSGSIGLDISRANLEKVLDPDQLEETWRILFRKLAERCLLHPEWHKRWKFTPEMITDIRREFEKYYSADIKWKRYDLKLDSQKPTEPTGPDADQALIDALNKIISSELRKKITDDLKIDIFAPVFSNSCGTVK